LARIDELRQRINPLILEYIDQVLQSKVDQADYKSHVLSEPHHSARHLPIGTILIYNGTDWEDDKTIPGWFWCNGQNGTPDLRNRFIKSRTDITAQPSYGGSNLTGNNYVQVNQCEQLTSSAVELVASAWVLNTSIAYLSTGGQSADHNHSMTHSHGGQNFSTLGTTPAYNVQFTGNTGGSTQNHTHTIPDHSHTAHHSHTIPAHSHILPAHSHTTEPHNHSFEPTFYSVIFIMRVF
jgi:hypothetical protein